MTFCIDLDGTISAAPVAMGAMMGALMQAGHRVYILTGAVDPNTEGAKVEGRERQLFEMGIVKGVHYVGVHVFVSPSVQWISDQKGVFCRDHNAVMFIDDSPMYLDSVMVIAPNTFRLTPHIMRPMKA